MTTTPHAPARRLTPHDLKARGWTPAMIRDLLGSPDATRPTDLLVGTRNRRVDGTVKLYDEARVTQAETTEAFARAQTAARVRQDTAEKAQAARQERTESQITTYVDAYAPQLLPPPDGTPARSAEHRKVNLNLLHDYEFSLDAMHLIGNLRGREWSEAASTQGGYGTSPAGGGSRIS